MALQPRRTPPRVRFQNWNNYADLRRNSFPANVNAPARWANSPTAREIAAILGRSVRLLPRYHPYIRALTTAQDMYQAFRQWELGVEGPQGQTSLPGTWQRFNENGIYPYTPTDANYPNFENLGINIGAPLRLANHRDDTAPHTTPPVWSANDNGYVYSVFQWRTYFGFHRGWYVDRFIARNVPAAPPMPSTYPPPDDGIVIVPDEAPGFQPGAIQMPGAETGSPFVPYRQIRDWNNIRDWMTPQNERHYGVNPRPIHWPAIQIEVTPGQPVRISPAPSHSYTRPPRGQPERKSDLGRSFQPLARFIGETAARRTVRSINAVTEANDWLNAFWFALPPEHRNPGARLPHEKALHLVANWQYLDMQQLAVNIALMEAQDRALGQLSQAAVRRLRAAPGSQQRGFEFFGSFI